MPRGSDQIDTAAWSKLLVELLSATGHTPDTAARPAGPVDVDKSTLYRWIRQSQPASAYHVRDTCRALGYSPTHGLVRVGWLTAEEAGIAGPAKITAAPDPLVRRVERDLADERVPEAARGELRRMVSEAHQGWLRMLKAFAQRPRK